MTSLELFKRRRKRKTLFNGKDWPTNSITHFSLSDMYSEGLHGECPGETKSTLLSLKLVCTCLCHISVMKRTRTKRKRAGALQELPTRERDAVDRSCGVAHPLNALGNEQKEVLVHRGG
jgi:hypothetical protein